MRTISRHSLGVDDDDPAHPTCQRGSTASRTAISPPDIAMHVSLPPPLPLLPASLPMRLLAYSSATTSGDDTSGRLPDVFPAFDCIADAADATPVPGGSNVLLIIGGSLAARRTDIMWVTVGLRLISVLGRRRSANEPGITPGDFRVICFSEVQEYGTGVKCRAGGLG